MSGNGASDNVALYYLRGLAARGVEHLYVNAGTDFAPLAEAYAAAEGRNEGLPAPIVCAHENLAAGMAHGAYLATGRPQAVMFHVSVGTANAICAIGNASRDNAPLLITAGRSPIFEAGALGARDTNIHWAQEMFDQAGMLREWVKWDYELRDGRQIDAVLDRALAVACTPPRGPVYLSLPREVLAGPMPEADPEQPRPAPPRTAPDPGAIAQLAARLAAARFPVVVTSAVGADPQCVKVLERLAERHGIGVVEAIPRYLNVRSDHPTYLGTDTARAFEAADVLLVLECDVPWISSRGAPRGDAFVAHAGIDPLFSRYPMRSHRADLYLAGTPALLLEALDDALAAHPADAARGARIARRATAARERLRSAASPSDPIGKAHLSAVLGAALPADTAVFNEYWGIPELLARREPGTYFYLPPAGGLGWALPAALGAALARRSRRTVALVGDGAYLFANPAACHHAAAKHALPVLTIIANNARWGAVEHATRSVYPDGLAVRTGESRLSDLGPSPDFAQYCRASDGFGERVERAAELEGALERALGAVAAGRQAVLDVRCV